MHIFCYRQFLRLFPLALNAAHLLLSSLRAFFKSFAPEIFTGLSLRLNARSYCSHFDVPDLVKLMGSYDAYPHQACRLQFIIPKLLFKRHYNCLMHYEGCTLNCLPERVHSSFSSFSSLLANSAILSQDALHSLAIHERRVAPLALSSLRCSVRKIYLFTHFIFNDYMNEIISYEPLQIK